MSFLEYKPMVFIEDIHQAILTSVCEYFKNEVQLKKVNEYAYLIVQKKTFKLEKIYLYCLLNEFTEEIYLGITRNIKKSLKNRTESIQRLGNAGEVVLHTLLILHIDSSLIGNIDKFKKKIEKAFLNKRFSIWKEDEQETKAEEINDELIQIVTDYDSLQEDIDMELNSVEGYGEKETSIYYKRNNFNLAEKLNKDELRIIKDVLIIFRNMLQVSTDFIDINNAGNETNLKLCNIILSKKSLIHLEHEEWRFISDVLENYYEVLKIRSNLPYYMINSDSIADTWSSKSYRENLLIKIGNCI